MNSRTARVIQRDPALKEERGRGGKGERGEERRGRGRGKGGEMIQVREGRRGKEGGKRRGQEKTGAHQEGTCKGIPAKEHAY